MDICKVGDKMGELKTRETLRIVVVGHVDHGKSTLIGRLLYDTKSLPEGAIQRVKEISKEKGKPFEYAYLLDAFEEEQKQGITIDTTQIQFFTKKRDYVIIDAPGHKEFLKNMISGAASAEAALLLIDANEGIQEQSKRHGYILSLLGIRKVYVLVNKMDLIDYSEEKYNAIQQEMNQFLHSLNVFPEKFIPISAFNGENITKHSSKMSWYKDEPVLKALDLFEKAKGLEEKPLRFPIQDVYKFDDRRIIAGRIETGTLKVGDEILISPGNKTTHVKTIEYWTEKDQKDTVYAGMSVGITVEDEFFNKRGQVISHMDTPPLVRDRFKANIFWLGKKELVLGQKYKLKLATEELECKIETINKAIDATTLEILDNAERVKTNDVAEVIIKTKQSFSFDIFSSNQSTGRFVLVDGYDVSGGGIITENITASKDLHIATVQRNGFVTQAERDALYGGEGKLLIVSGGSQQTNVEQAANLERNLFTSGTKVYYLELTKLLPDIKDRPNAKQINFLLNTAKILVENGITVILADSAGFYKKNKIIKNSQELKIIFIDGDTAQIEPTVDYFI